MYSMDAIVPRAWSINWRSYEPCKKRNRHAMQVYLREREWSSFYLATANQRDAAKRNRAGAWRIAFARPLLFYEQPV